ncbi:7TM diverse intracellular signaling domain-containing protein [Pseudobacteriovorax antillogorgiicola]|uniref:Histidine kinase-, DNA gyrase B-, and HSP90-like ATPase n=1 Tax=Pseudobacteriovorax antillogorgiicola TaxID=1513793 RepID=A0A1Y6B7J4_9BACT|nr:7TM diverse intracellular signaling domain-containing protein [Pseudobacteriovorax antillogorgiicola]TCS58791.1 histidine kinase/DNA gyrase B/HSP90-like ATPase [Pseudobacteriovorax antillogorgiicola]SME94685.1 Histidine kinase-, DNA gyrase B-, and HSP90-like ATPase [Pseudobacteriovorax antillogorgiicola]
MPLAWFFCLGYILLSPPAAYGKKPLVIEQDFQYENFSSQFSYYPDPDHNLTLDDILEMPSAFTPVKSQIPAFGFRDSTYWFWGKVDYRIKEARNFYLTIDYPMLDIIEIFFLQDGKLHHRVQTGDATSFFDRPIDHRNFVIPHTFDPNSQWDVLIRVRSHSTMKVGVSLYEPLYFWQQDSIINSLHFLYFGVLLVMIVYNAFVYLVVRDIGYVYYVLYVSAFLVFQISLTGFDYQYLWPFSPLLHERAIPFSISCSMLFMCLFTREFLGFKGRYPFFDKLCLFYASVSAVLIPISLIGPYLWVIRSAASFGLIASVSCFFVSMCLVKKHVEARYFFLAFTIYLVGGMFLSLSKFGLVADVFLVEHGMQIGSAFEVVLLSLALARRIKKLQDQKNALFEEIKDINNNLEQEVASKTKKLRSLLDNIPQGVISIGKGLKMGDEFSKEVEAIFCVKPRPGESFVAYFLDRLNLGDDEKARIESSLKASVGEASYCFDVNVSHLPHEVVLQRQGQKPVLLDLDWNYELDNESNIRDIVLSFRDVTELRKLQMEANQNLKELKFISELIQCQMDVFFKFLNKALQYIEENMRLATASDDYQESHGDIMFINIHTLKGLSRQIGLSLIIEKTHAMESYYGKLRNKKAPWSQKKIIDDLKQLRNYLRTYEDIAEDKLGWSQVRSQTTISDRAVRELIQTLQSIMVKMPEPNEGLNRIYQTFSSMYYVPLQKVINEAVQDIPRLAKDLEKPTPEIALSGMEIRVTPRCTLLIQDIMVHLLRNAMDHGIESEAIRRAKGKSVQGKITIGARIERGQCFLDVYDDGQGLAIDRINRLVDHGDEPWSHDQLIDVLFSQGLSTSHEVNEISGRGVGMAAVKRYLEEAGCQILTEFSELTEFQGERFLALRFSVILTHELFESSSFEPIRTLVG